MILLSIKSQIRNQVEFCLFDSLGWLVLVSRFTILSYFFTVKGKRSQIRIVGVLSRITLVLTLTLFILRAGNLSFSGRSFCQVVSFPLLRLSFFTFILLLFVIFAVLVLMGINCLIFYLIVF